jgi:ribosome-binding factor A
MGEEDEINRSLEGLKNCCGFIKKNMRQRLKLRNLPSIRFLYDKSIYSGMKISEILQTLDKDKR